jgi:hypothetical protein
MQRIYLVLFILFVFIFGFQLLLSAIGFIDAGIGCRDDMRGLPCGGCYVIFDEMISR